jgi:hypothetical protein
MRRAICSARSASASPRSRVSGSALRTPSSGAETLANRCVDAVQFEASVSQPLLQVGHRRRIVVVEMRAGGEQLDTIESVRANLDQMLASQPLAVVKVRRHPEGPLQVHW